MDDKWVMSVGQRVHKTFPWVPFARIEFPKELTTDDAKARADVFIKSLIAANPKIAWSFALSRVVMRSVGVLAWETSGDETR